MVGGLYSNEDSWPFSEVSATLDEAFLERSKTGAINLATGNEVRFGDKFLYLSSYKKILRMIAYVLRFCNIIKINSPKLVNSLSCKDIEKEEESLIKIMQSEWPSEIRENQDGVEHVAKLRLASGEIIQPLQRIYPLELSASDHLIDDHQGTDIAAQIPGPTATDVLGKRKKSGCGRPLIPVKRLNL
ncbi:DUF1758 domain-containing protein [Trichonephila inaurata madagascariensis]|uniref:DUF1758 domain-containing protein n=1 Tax=Trichonephila inaurata madagascariensis TaxID=2747483 RepID=A0A8X7CGV8_9ARAC|nr:DUF1758 domain-containing protein [Trichonephila inaurata madagascariensis]